jgi:hypothetical protein
MHFRRGFQPKATDGYCDATAIHPSPVCAFAVNDLWPTDAASGWIIVIDGVASWRTAEMMA